MKCLKFTVLVLLAVICKFVSSVTGDESLVVSTTESTKEEGGKSTNKEEQDFFVNPKIYSMEIHSNISNRFATTLITSKVKNLKNTSAETTFTVILPENAFISEFIMEIDGKAYKAYVKEKEEAKRIYEEAVSTGRSAGHVEVNARDSKKFTVSINLEPESKTIFKLTYEELLKRLNGQYELIVNIHPGQIVDDLNVQVHINESRPLTLVQTPSLRTGNEISKNNDDLNPFADIELINATSAVVKFNPTKDKQKHFAELLGSNKENGLSGQFVVQYEVERDPQGGEVLVRDGYFVHFFSPSELEPLQKHVVFVLDHSGSMGGRKFEQLTEAMKKILTELNVNDLFNLIRFSEVASVWNVTENRFIEINLNTPKYGELELHLREMSVPEGIPASEENVEKAKQIITDSTNMGLTNIIAGLEVGLFLIKKTRETFPKKYQPMLIFLTDGLPNVGMYSGNEITNTVNKLNAGENRASIFSLSFGTGADKAFLQELSSKNLGFSRHIFEASDASLQLQDFYRTISSPLLSNVTFKYVDGVSHLTKHSYPILFNGSELVVAGKTNDISNIALDVSGKSKTGLIKFKPIIEEPVSSVERLWAYLTVKQLLNERETATNKTELTKKALDLALKYSFVTSVSSLVVVKPNQTESVSSRNIQKQHYHQRSRIGAMPIAPSMSRANRFHSSPRQHFAMRGPVGAPGMSYAGGYPRAYPVGRQLIISGHHQMPKSRVYSPHMHTSTPRPPRPRPTTARVATEKLEFGCISCPQWLKDLKNNNQNITTPQGSFKIEKGDNITTYSHPDCPRTPLNGTGTCEFLTDCIEVFPQLTDIQVYFQYFCSLNEYAGICCPPKKNGRN